MWFGLALGQDAEQAPIGSGDVGVINEGDAEGRVSLEAKRHDGDDNEEHGSCCHHLQLMIT